MSTPIERDHGLGLLRQMVLIRRFEEKAADIPEADYPQLATLDACVAYLEARRRS